MKSSRIESGTLARKCIAIGVALGMWYSNAPATSAEHQPLPAAVTGVAPGLHRLGTGRHTIFGIPGGRVARGRVLRRPHRRARDDGVHISCGERVFRHRDANCDETPVEPSMLRYAPGLHVRAFLSEIRRGLHPLPPSKANPIDRPLAAKYTPLTKCLRTKIRSSLENNFGGGLDDDEKNARLYRQRGP